MGTDGDVDNLRVDFSLPTATVRAAMEVATNSGSLARSSPPPSFVRMTKTQFAQSMVTLTLLKRTSEFTKPELAAWYAVLGSYPWKVLNRAVVQAALAADKFPDVGDLCRECDRLMPAKPYSAYGGDEKWRPSKSLIESVAKEMGLDV